MESEMILTVHNFGRAMDDSYRGLREVYPVVGDLIEEHEIYNDKEANAEFIVKREHIEWTIAVITGKNYKLTRTEYNADADVATWRLTRQPKIGDRIYKHGEFSHVLHIKQDVEWYSAVLSSTMTRVHKLIHVHRYKSDLSVWNLVYR